MVFFTPAALFPAVSLMMINYSYIYSSLSIFNRKMHNDFIESKSSKGEEYISKYLQQTNIFIKRFYLNRSFKYWGL